MLLAIDTATNLAGIALLNGQQIPDLLHRRADDMRPSAGGQGVRGATQWRTGRNHTVELMPNILRLLSEAGARADELEAVAVAIGPGSYTGLRIGLSVAKGFCLAHGAALVAVPTLDISAMASPLRDGLLCAVLQAGRGRLAAGFYRAESGQWQRDGELFFGRAPELAEACAGQRASSPLQQDFTRGEPERGHSPRSNAAQSRSELPAASGLTTYFAGELDEDSVTILRERLAGLASFAPEGEWKRDPRVLARLGWERLRLGLTDNLETLAPAYGQ